jgi:hypothetical protein
MSQGLRPSQYITTFGPGAIVETPSGPHILCGTEEVLSKIQNAGIKMDDLSIRDMRLQKGLLSGDKIFKLPDSDNWDNFMHPTRRFPTWNLCVQHLDANIIHKSDEGCPVCKGPKREESKKSKYAIRFLVACPNGHLDDVNWRFLVHADRNNPSGAITCPATHFLWVGSGASLSAIRIRCPVCSSQKELGEIYSSRLKCRGRRPENPGTDFEDCSSDEAIVVQRGSFQLRLPEVITSLTIPPLVTALHRILQREDMQLCILTVKTFGFTEENFLRLLNAWTSERKIPIQVSDQLKNVSWGDIREAIEAIDSVSGAKTRLEYLQQEHLALTDVIETGFPPYPTEGERRPGEPVSFQVESTAIRRDVLGPAGDMQFRVMPIERLRVVMVQVGYRRVDYDNNPQLSPSRGRHPLNADQYWIPGVEQFGEGIYIDLNPNFKLQRNWYPQGSSTSEWENKISPTAGPNDLVIWNALSVWWHSLSHRLINALSLHSGYSSTAIRERIYLSPTADNELRGGILLYTTQPGGDGTMGGLTSLVPQFDHIFQLALANIERCSNDPLCEHAEIDPISKLGAACYSCQMVSETSCEHYNGYLNRRILLDNLP